MTVLQIDKKWFLKKKIRNDISSESFNKNQPSKKNCKVSKLNLLQEELTVDDSSNSEVDQLIGDDFEDSRFDSKYRDALVHNGSMDG